MAEALQFDSMTTSGYLWVKLNTTSENLQAEKSACGRRMRIDKIEKLYKLYSTYSKVDYEKVAYFLQWSSIIIKFVQRESPIDIK